MDDHLPIDKLRLHGFINFLDEPLAPPLFVLKGRLKLGNVIGQLR